jgi:hypothetical protein
MNGNGWQCDYCGEKVIMDAPPLSYRDTGTPHLPPSWYLIFGPWGNDQYEFKKQYHFCSAKCAHEYLYIEIKNSISVSDTERDNNGLRKT